MEGKFTNDEIVALEQAKQLIREVLDSRWQQVTMAVTAYLNEALRDIEKARQYLEVR